MTSRKREVLRLAWPAVGSYILHNAYRINDQFWIQGLGADAQAAVGASFFVIILNFAALFLAAGGALALVARATGANDTERAHSVTRHAIFFATMIALVIGFFGAAYTEEIVAILGLPPGGATFAEEYLKTLYIFLVPIALVPVLDNSFIGRGKTKIPLMLDCAAIGINYFLNPIMIYGGTAVAEMDLGGVVPFGAEWADSIANTFNVEAGGMRGAALATCLSRTVTTLAGIAILRFGFGMHLLGSLKPKLARLIEIAKISAPVSGSIAVFAGVYLLLFTLVLRPFSIEVKAGMGIGFQVFEGLAFPCYLGVGMAAASLVGQKLGAGNPKEAMEVVKAARFVGRCLGVFMTIVFLFVGEWIVPFFTQDPAVKIETLRYVGILAFSQYWVSVEAVNEKTLLGAGYTRPIFWISSLGNVLRIPLAWLLASYFGFGAAGIWWSINATTYLKAGLFWKTVQSNKWAERLGR